MLVLSRRTGESVVLPNDQITVRILQVKGNQVRLGFEAPRETEIHREEVWCRMSQEEDARVDEEPVCVS